MLRQSAHEGDKVVSPTHRPPLPPRKYSWYSFLLESESTSGRIMSIKIPMTQSGIDSANFRFVAQFLNHCATACLQPYLKEEAPDRAM
jgi:hypothetical protein